MWPTPVGTRTLDGSEAELVRQLIGYVFYHIDVVCREMDEAYSVGVSTFERLTAAQQLALLAEVGEALLLERAGSPHLSAVREATVAVLFEELRSCIEVEIETEEMDGPPNSYWRTLARESVLEQLGEEDSFQLPTAESPNLDEWVILIECLAGRILWDDDWAMEAEFADAVPETNRRLKEFLGIDNDYFIDIAPDPTDQQMPSIQARLSSLAPRYGG